MKPPLLRSQPCVRTQQCRKWGSVGLLNQCPLLQGEGDRTIPCSKTERRAHTCHNGARHLQDLQQKLQHLQPLACTNIKNWQQRDLQDLQLGT